MSTPDKLIVLFVFAMLVAAGLGVWDTTSDKPSRWVVYVNATLLTLGAGCYVTAVVLS